MLLSVPRQSLVTIASHPDQTLLQMASLAFDQAPSWYSTAASLELGTRALPQAAASHGRAQLVEAGKGVQTEADGSQGVGEKLVEAGKGAQAEADGSQGVVVKLVEAWLQPGKVELTLPGRLLMAQLWPEHEASGFGHQCIQALSGVVPVHPVSKVSVFSSSLTCAVWLPDRQVASCDMCHVSQLGAPAVLTPACMA